MRPAARGFTLIEVMVSLLIMAAMSAMAWKGVDGIMRSRDIAEASVSRTLRMQSVMAQVQVDLAAVEDTGVLTAVQFDGASLRLTRRAPEGGMQVVVWSLRGDRWLRWSGPSVLTVGQLEDQLNRSQSLQGPEPGTLTALRGVSTWQIYFQRDGAWTNAQSSAGQGQGQTLGQAMARNPLPRAVRCVMGMDPSSGFSGTLTRDMPVARQPNQG